MNKSIMMACGAALVFTTLGGLTPVDAAEPTARVTQMQAAPATAQQIAELTAMVAQLKSDNAALKSQVDKMQVKLDQAWVGAATATADLSALTDRFNKHKHNLTVVNGKTATFVPKMTCIVSGFGVGAMVCEAKGAPANGSQISGEWPVPVPDTTTSPTN